MEIIDKITEKRELRDIDREFVKKLLKEEKIIDLNKKEEKELVKKIRKKLRIVYGMFRNNKEKRDSNVYDKIFSVIGKCKSILDLGCGLDPLSLKNYEYYAFDISKNEIDKINKYFKENKIKGKAEVLDLTNRNNFKKLPKTDVCFMFRLLESLESIERGISKDLLKAVRCKYIVVSFSKIALGQRKMIKKSGRLWFRRYLGELKYEWEDFDYGNEIFFVIRKV